MALSEIQRFNYDIAASLHACPATIEELCERDFLKTYSREGIDRALYMLESRGMVWFRNKDERYFLYKSAIKILNKEGYELS